MNMRQPNMRRPIHHLRGEETLGWGIVGASHVAAQHVIPAIRAQTPLPVAGARYAMTNSWVAALHSHDERRAHDFAEDHQIPHAYVNLSDLLRRPDIQCIYIGCHPRHHAAFISAALAADKHVLCESPLALNLDEAHALAQTAAQHDRVLAVNFPNRGNPGVVAARELFMDGEIGELLGGRISNTTFLQPAQQTWRLRSPGGGVLWDRAAHTLDTLRFLLRDDLAALDCVRHQTVFGTAAQNPVDEDVLTRVTLRRTGFIFQCHDSFVVPHLPTSVELYGTQGALTIRHCFELDHPTELYLRRRREDIPIRLPTNAPFAVAVARFHAAVRQGQRPQATAADGIAALSGILAGHESLRRGYRVDVPERPRFITDTSYI